MTKHRRPMWFLLVAGGTVATLLLGAVACSTDLAPLEERLSRSDQTIAELQASVASLNEASTSIASPPGEKHFFVTGVEWKGSTSATELAQPAEDPADLSRGYGFKGTGVYDASNPDKWQVASYVWTPGSMVVSQGDTVKLTFFIVNGNRHATWVQAPDMSVAVTGTEMNRGREYEMSFVASQPGVYKLLCDTHGPSMAVSILVLPRT